MRLALVAAAAALTGTLAVADGGLTAARDALTAVNDRFNAYAAEHDAAGLLSLYAEDTLWIEQGKPATQGLEGPRALFEFVAAQKGDVSHTIDHLFVADDASLAVMIGSVDAEMESVGLDATGTYLFVLTPDGDDWKVVTDMWHQHDE